MLVQANIYLIYIFSWHICANERKNYFTTGKILHFNYKLLNDFQTFLPLSTIAT